MPIGLYTGSGNPRSLHHPWEEISYVHTPQPFGAKCRRTNAGPLARRTESEHHGVRDHGDARLST
jgi:hypothetical protein